MLSRSTCTVISTVNMRRCQKPRSWCCLSTAVMNETWRVQRLRKGPRGTSTEPEDDISDVDIEAPQSCALGHRCLSARCDGQVMNDKIIHICFCAWQACIYSFGDAGWAANRFFHNIRPWHKGRQERERWRRSCGESFRDRAHELLHVDGSPTQDFQLG